MVALLDGKRFLVVIYLVVIKENNCSTRSGDEHRWRNVPECHMKSGVLCLFNGDGAYFIAVEVAYQAYCMNAAVEQHSLLVKGDRFSVNKCGIWLHRSICRWFNRKQQPAFINEDWFCR